VPEAITDPTSARRSANYVRQIKGSALAKGLALLMGFLVVPIMISFLGVERYGVWSTLLSVMSWVVFFDLGIGNGLRNKVAELLAASRRGEVANYISSAYAGIGFIALLLYLLSFTVAPYVPWQSIFNTQLVPRAELVNIVRITSFFILFNFWVGLVGALIGAIQKTAMLSIGQFIANALVLLLTYLVSLLMDSSIVYMAILYGVSIVVANIALSIWFFRRNPDFIPRLNFSRGNFQPLMKVGVQFFLLQMAVLVIFTTDKILLTQLFGPSSVTSYDVVFKVFSIVAIGHTLINAPLWSAYTDAYHRGDMVWISAMIRIQLRLFFGLLLLILLLVFAAAPIIRLWIAPDFQVSNSMVLAMALFTGLSMWNNIFAFVVNGIGNLKVQLYTAILAMLLNIPISVILVKHFHFGPSGVVIATCLVLLMSAVAIPLQVSWILSRGADS
jgi:O-antigen/teichoic acid export membrane protein